MKNNLAFKIIIALVLGAILGTIIQLGSDPSHNNWLYKYVIFGLFQTSGDIFIRLITLLVVPLIFISIVNAICGLDDISQFGRLGLKTFLLYLLNTAIAIIFTLIVAYHIKVGAGANLSLEDRTLELTSTNIPSLLQLIINIVPQNPFKALVDGNVLQIVFMAIVAGIAIKKLDNKETHRVHHAIKIANNIMMLLIGMVMSLAPYGVFFLTGKLAATLDSHSLASVLGYVLTTLTIMFFWIFIFYPSVIGIIIRINPFTFIKKIREQILFSLATASSNATIPVTYRTLTKQLGVSEKVAGFSVPLGATMNMSGAAIYMVVATLFVANAYNIHLSFDSLFILATSTFLLAIAAGGIPGGAVVTTGVLLHQMGLPIEGLGIIIATDRILDAVCTTSNVVGDTVVGSIVGKTEGMAEQKNQIN